MLALGTLTGLVDSDPTLHWTPPFVRYRSEVVFIQLGNATITGIPGELYPEIAVGVSKTLSARIICCHLRKCLTYAVSYRKGQLND